jgi:methionyl-tRNA synthetase
MLLKLDYRSDFKKMNEGNNIEDYFDKCHLNSYLQGRYEKVQAANLYMQEQAPWTKLKSEETRADGIADLQHLLWVIKQLTLFSAPFLINSFNKVQEILGNPLLSQIDSSVNLTDPALFAKVFNLTEFDIQLQADVVYQKKESTNP